MKNPIATLHPLIKIALPAVAAAAAGLAMVGGGMQSRTASRSSRNQKPVAASVAPVAAPPSHDPLFAFSSPPPEHAAGHTAKQIVAKTASGEESWAGAHPWHGYTAGRSSGALLDRLNGGAGLLGKLGLSAPCSGAPTWACTSAAGALSGQGCSNDSDCIPPSNSAPTITGATAGQAVNDNSTISPFSGVTIGDADASQTQTVSVTLDTAAKGSFTTLNGFTNAGGGVYTYSGTAANATTAIRGLVFTPTANRVAPGSTETTTFTISTNDGVASAVTNNTTTVVSTSVNNSPAFVTGTTANITVAGNSSDTDITSYLSITDPDASQTETWTVSVATNHGGVVTAGTTASSGAGSRTPSGWYYRPATGYAGTETFTIQVSDGTATATRAFSVTVTAVNTAPTFVSGGAGSLTVAQAASATDIIGLLHVGDTDSSQTETWSQSVAPSHGTLSFSSATASSGSADITPGGTITYTPTASYVGSDSFTVQVSDGTASATRVINVTVGSARTVTVDALTLNGMTAGTAFVSQSFSGAGGYGAYTYSVSAGSLPAGLSLNAGSGALTGTPTTAGAYNFTIQASDASTGSGPYNGTRAFSGTVNAAPASVSVVTAPSNGTYRAAQNLDFVLQFTGTVTGTPRIALTVGGSTVYATYLSGSGGTTLTFRYAVQAGDTDTDGINATSPIELNGGTLIDANSQNATLTWTVPDLSGVKVDTSAPTTPTVTAPANGYYKALTNLDFTVTYGETVLVTGTPRIALTVGSSTVYADYLSGSNSSALTFRYTVQAGDTDTDGIAATSPIALNSGTVKDVAGNDATLTYTVPTLTSVFVDTTAPSVHATTPIAAANGSNGGNSTTTYDAQDVITLKFTEPVLVANITNANIVVNNGHTLDSPTIAATDKASYNNTHATTFTLTLGASPTVAVGDTLTIALANLVDRAANAAASNAVFTLPGFNALPTAGSVAVALPGGTVAVAAGVLLTGSYVFNDSDGDTESGTTFQWYTATNTNCTTGQATIGGATNTTYTVLASQEGKYLCFGVTPKTATGNSPGVEVLAASAQFANAAPTLESRVPADAATGVALSTTLSFTFNEGVSAIANAGGAPTFWLCDAPTGAGPYNLSTCPPIATFEVGANTNNNAAPMGSAAISGNTVTLTPPASVTLAYSKQYYLFVSNAAVQDAVNNAFAGAQAAFTTTAAPSGGGATPAPTNTTTLPTGGGTATLIGGQSVTVTENGKDGTSINLPPPGTGSTSNSVNITLPGTGTVGVSSSATGTQLGVTHVTLPGSTTAVSTVTVDSGSASFTASQSGQAVAGLKNGIVVVSGSNNSQVTVDATGANARIGVKTSDTIIVPTGSAGVAGTRVDLPSPTASGQASTVNLNVGGQSLTIQSGQANTSMTFQVVDIGGIQTPVLAVSGAAQVTGGGDNQPIVSVGGKVIRSGNSGNSGGQKCNTVIQASSDTSSDMVHVVTCYIVLETGTFSAMGGTGNGFAAIKDGIVWAGETAEFDKNGKVTSAYLGTRSGDTAAAGDDLQPGGNKFAATGGYTVTAFIPRLAGTPLRLNGAKLDDSIFAAANRSAGTVMQPGAPVQSSQGVLNFTMSGDAAQALKMLNSTLSGDTVSVLPSRRIRVDTSRADGVSISAEGEVDVATGGLITTFVPSVADPKAFADKVAQALPGSTLELRWNGTWQATAADGTAYVGRPQWSFRGATPGAATFAATPDNNLLYSDNGRAQVLFTDFADYTTLQATFRAELNDPALSVLPRMDGTALATVNGKSYILAPQWSLIKPAAGKPAWWMDNGVIYIRNADGSAQGFTVR